MTARRTTGPLEKALTAALRTAETLPRDGATKALATRYARLMDEADLHAAEAAQAFLELDPADVFGRARLEKLAAAVKAHTVASDLGPKLLAALDKLLMTPAGRGVKPAGGDPHAAITARIDEFTRRRLGQHHA